MSRRIATRRSIRPPPWERDICSRLGKAGVSFQLVRPSFMRGEGRGRDGEKAEVDHGAVVVPLELFRPRPSLSTTSCAHCTDGRLGLWPPRRRNVLDVSVRAAAVVAVVVVVVVVVVVAADEAGPMACEASAAARWC